MKQINILRNFAEMAFYLIVVSLSTSCSNDLFFDDLEYSKTISYEPYVFVDLSKTIDKYNSKDKYMFMEALNRIDQNIKIENGKATLSHLTSKDLNINREFFDFISSKLELMDTEMVKKYLIQTRRPTTRGVYDELVMHANMMIGISLVIAQKYAEHANCPLIYDLYERWVRGKGDYTLTDSEWTDLLGAINLHKPSDYGSSLYDSQSNLYYYQAGSNLNDTKYHYALGWVKCFWNTNHDCIGIHELYDMNLDPREDDFGQYCVTYAHIYGKLIGAKDYYVNKGFNPN